jgi:hypothetical protein
MRRGQPLPDDELEPCGTRAAYRRHLRRGDPVDESCRQAEARAWQDRVADGYERPSRGRRVHRALRFGMAKCGRGRVAVSSDPGEVTCLNCLGGHRRMPWVPARQQPGERSRAA